VQSKPSGLYTKEEIKTRLTTIVPLRITGIPRTFPKGQISLLITIEARQITTPNTTHPMHHDGCKTRLYQWTLAIQEPPTVDEEDEEALEEEGASMANTTINPLITSRITPQT